jgi:hypothetical protein
MGAHRDRAPRSKPSARNCGTRARPGCSRR